MSRTSQSQQSRPRLDNSPVLRAAVLIALLVVELSALAIAYSAPTIFSPQPAADKNWHILALYQSRHFWKEGVWVVATVVLFLAPRSSTVLSSWRRHAEYGTSWILWLCLHGLSFSAFAVTTDRIFAKPTDPEYLTQDWFVVWSAFGVALSLFWLLALAPIRFWRELARTDGIRLCLGAATGILAAGVNRALILQEAPLAQLPLWQALSTPSLYAAGAFLEWFYPEVVFDPEQAVVGTPSFSVRVTYACSGIEGITLVTIFLALYMWLFRRDLRFPHVFLLFPLGIAASWIGNVLRIAALVAIGTSVSPEIALQGFHEQAGWAIFTLIALGIIFLLHRARIFSVTLASSAPANYSTALALLLPLMAHMGGLMVSSMFFSDFDALYPIRILAVAGVMFYFRHAYRAFAWGVSWTGVSIGLMVSFAWILLEPADPDTDARFEEILSSLPVWGLWLWLCARVVGSVLVIPLAEEFAFRGYLLRKLVADDFSRVPFRQVTWFPFVASSLAFGLLHGQRWLAGTLAGMAFAWAARYKNRLADAVVAHSVANAVISGCALLGGTWHLWV